MAYYHSDTKEILINLQQGFVPQRRHMNQLLLLSCLFVSFLSISVALVPSQLGVTSRYGRTCYGRTLHEISAQQITASSYQDAAAIDWNLYDLKHRYHKSGGILYKPSLLSPDEYNAILSELSQLQLRLEDEKDSSFATKRMGCQIERDTEIFRILSCPEGSLCRLLNALEDHDGRMILAPDIPIELRLYETTGAGMEWHIDDILYNPAQIEVVLTLENSSDCCTMWKPHNQPLESVQTTPNAALILQSGGVEHKVSPLRVGRRVILKLAYVRKEAVILEDMMTHASHHSGGKSKKNKNSRRKI